MMSSLSFFPSSLFAGVVAVEVSGYDHVLDADCHVYWAFTLPEDVALYARFADMVLVKCVVLSSITSLSDQRVLQLNPALLF